MSGLDLRHNNLDLLRRVTALVATEALARISELAVERPALQLKRRTLRVI